MDRCSEKLYARIKRARQDSYSFGWAKGAKRQHLIAADMHAREAEDHYRNGQCMLAGKSIKIAEDRLKKVYRPGRAGGR